MVRFGLFAATLAFFIGVGLVAVAAATGFSLTDEERAWAGVFLVSTYLLITMALAKELKV